MWEDLVSAFGSQDDTVQVGFQVRLDEEPQEHTDLARLGSHFFLHPNPVHQLVAALLVRRSRGRDLGRQLNDG
jgi:hypothetical protein